MTLKRTFLHSCGALLIGLAAVHSPPAFAVNDAMLDLLKILRDKGSLTQDEYDMLKNASKADAEHVNFAKEEVKRIDTTNIVTKDKFTFTSKDGDFEWQPIGRIMADYHIVDSDLYAIDTEGAFGVDGIEIGIDDVIVRHDPADGLPFEIAILGSECEFVLGDDVGRVDALYFFLGEIDVLGVRLGGVLQHVVFILRETALVAQDLEQIQHGVVHGKGWRGMDGRKPDQQGAARVQESSFQGHASSP